MRRCSSRAARTQHRTRADERARPGRDIRRANRVRPLCEGPGGRDHPPLHLPQPVPASRLQRRSASRQLPLPRRRSGDLPRLRPDQAVHRRGPGSARRRGPFPGFRKGLRGLPRRTRAGGFPEVWRSGVHRSGGRPLRPVLRHRAPGRADDHHAGLFVRDRAPFLRRARPAGALFRRAASLRDHAADQPRPLRPARQPDRHRELETHRGRDLAVPQWPAVDADRRGRSPLGSNENWPRSAKSAKELGSGASSRLFTGGMKMASSAGSSVLSSMSPEERRKQMVRAVVASTVGTSIEWYDYFLFGTMAGLVFPHLFFPKSDQLAGTLNSYAIFFVGFLAWPVGAWLFGTYGDRIGRKATLIVTLLSMGIATFLIGVMPTYANIGLWAAVILVILRACQG